MNIKTYQLEKYRKFLLNRVSVTPEIVEYMENTLSSEEVSAHHSFHKIMIHNWTASESSLFDTVTEYFSASFIPVNYTSLNDLSSFYTSSLGLVLKITKLDFMFPHQRNMYSIDILFNDKTSADCFENRITIEDIVTGIVSCRFTDKMELDLSNFCNDPEFVKNKINFYKLNLLSNFKILMLRMGRDTKILNLSKNNLSTVPVDILNFFLRGNLVAINFSDNNFEKINELYRVSSQIEKMWVEGNPLCESYEDPLTYVKDITIKFPRLIELDGIKLNQHGIVFPFFKNYMATPDKRTQIVVEKFLRLYFAHFDALNRKKIEMFYAENAHFTLATSFTEEEDKIMSKYAHLSRNILNPKKRQYYLSQNKFYKKRDSIRSVLTQLPISSHDPSTFTVDVLMHNNSNLMLVLDGVYKEFNSDVNVPDKFFQFRRTFIFSIKSHSNSEEYSIINEMFCVSPASQIMINSFKDHARTNPNALHDPDKEEASAICNVFANLTNLIQPEADRRLKIHSYDLRRTIKDFLRDLRQNKIPAEHFAVEDFSDAPVIEDEVD